MIANTSRSITKIGTASTSKVKTMLIEEYSFKDTMSSLKSMYVDIQSIKTKL